MYCLSIDLVATGARIQALREERHMRVSEISAYMGFDVPQAVYKWQRGEGLPSADNLVVLNHLFRVSMEDILVLSGEVKLGIEGIEGIEGRIENSYKKRTGYDILITLMEMGKTSSVKIHNLLCCLLKDWCLPVKPPSCLEFSPAAKYTRLKRGFTGRKRGVSREKMPENNFPPQNGFLSLINKGSQETGFYDYSPRYRAITRNRKVLLRLTDGVL